jgi:Asp-tRNA(Asn)/Glu-tRNA(Gln) amidotransferase A subunit family amidase
MHADIARNYGPLFDAAPDKISQTLAAIIADGRKVLAVDYNTALDMQRKLRLSIEQLFEHFNAIITPASAGPAPEGLTSTGNPVFCTSWTFMGLPAISLPLLEVNGMPMGVQLTGAFGDEARLLRTANWLIQHLSQS